MSKPWFEQWFNTEYYHILYKNRDHKEAEDFIDRLYNHFDLQDEFVCDLACGKGRHSKYLNKKGLKVLGLDLATESIKEASQFENENLKFDTHDMRDVYPEVSFDYVFNLFTSFGYFDHQDDNLKVLNSVHQMLNDNGRLIIDFLNATHVVDNLIVEEVKAIEGIDFKINKSFDGSHILKRIQFEDGGKEFDYTEKVQAVSYSDFKRLLQETGFEFEAVYGDYKLNPFDEKTSSRLIVVAKKA